MSQVTAKLLAGESKVQIRTNSEAVKPADIIGQVTIHSILMAGYTQAYGYKNEILSFLKL